MKNMKKTIGVRQGYASLAFVLAVWGAASAASAQVGSGWTSYSSGKNIQRVPSSAYYSNSGGIETFRITSGQERSEVRFTTEWTSGQRQFEGYVYCSSGAGTDGGSSVQQIMKVSSGSHSQLQQVRIKNASSGTLYILQNQATLTTSAYGRWLRVNVIHNRSNNTAEAYLNGSRKSTISLSGGGSNYFKYGIYLRSGQVQWKSVRLWRK